MQTNWMTRQEAARYLRISDNKLDLLTAKGLPFYSISKRKKIWNKDEIDEWVAGRRY